jgi:hypothetical protein
MLLLLYPDAFNSPNVFMFSIFIFLFNHIVKYVLLKSHYVFYLYYLKLNDLKLNNY